MRGRIRRRRRLFYRSRKSDRQEATSFTATLSQSKSVQLPDEYEGEKGERVQAIPTGRRNSNPFVPTGVEMAMTVHPDVPVEVKAVSSQELEAERHEEEVTQLQGAVKQLEEDDQIAAVDKKQQEAEAATRKAQVEVTELTDRRKRRVAG
jgi:hypothetical protein